MSFRRGDPGGSSPRLSGISLSFKDMSDWFLGLGNPNRARTPSDASIERSPGTSGARRVPSTSLLAKRQQASGWRARV